MDSKQYTKLKDLIGKTFTVIDVPGYKYKMWDAAEKRMVARDTPAQGFRKLYQVETDKGHMDLGSGQIGTLLEATFDHGTADLIGKTFKVGSNGKEGVDVRYYFDLAEETVQDNSQDVVLDDIEEDGKVDLDSIPF